MKCKTCGHEYWEKTARNGNKYLEHKPHIVMGIVEGHGFICDCVEVKPCNEVQQ